MIIGMKIEGRNFFSIICVAGSKTEYEMKNIVSVKLYWLLVMFRSVCRPSIFAFPILVLSRKDAK